jgi:hypothetical protein
MTAIAGLLGGGSRSIVVNTDAPLTLIFQAQARRFTRVYASSVRVAAGLRWFACHHSLVIHHLTIINYLIVVVVV